MEFPFGIGLFVAAAALTYVFCVRPMRRGQGHCGTGKPARQVGGDQQAHEGEAEDTARQRAEIARLREEIESLKRRGDSTGDGTYGRAEPVRARSGANDWSDQRDPPP